MESQSEVLDRLARIFDAFLSSNFTTSNNVYFEKLLTQLAAPEHAYVLQSAVAIEWVEKCIVLVSEDFDRVNPKVISFMLNFCGLLASNEWVIIQIRERKIMDKLLFFLKTHVQRFNPSMKLGSIRLFQAVSKYSLGLGYIRAARAWDFLIDYCNQDHTLYVVREARQLVYELLYKFSVKTRDEKLVEEMLAIICKPIMDNLYEEEDGKIMIEVDDSELQHKMASTLDLISYIFQQTLESEQKANIVNICHEKFQFQITIWKLCEMTHNEIFLKKILNTMTSYNYAKLVQEQWHTGEIPPDNFNDFGVFFYNIVKFTMKRGDCFNMLKTIELNHILWKKLGKRAPQEIVIEKQRVRFENQLIMFHLLPVLIILRAKDWAANEFFENYVMKILTISCDQTLRIGYELRELLYRSPQLNADLAYKSIHGILSLDKVLEREEAILVFQAIIYALKEFIGNHEETADAVGNMTLGEPTASVGAARYELVVEASHVLYACLIALQTLIQRYRIAWKDSLETICVVNFMAIILKNPNLSSRVTVQALKVVQLAIEHFLSPNMALLVDNLEGSGLLNLGPIIKARCHDSAWEVRDSTLELVTSIANISRLKFPAFQKFLVDFEVCPLVYQMAQNDSEPYVRASALKCLGQMVKINYIWEVNDLGRVEFIEHLFFLLYNESEGIVRKEAICTLSKIYSHRNVPKEYTDTLYSTLCHTATNDLHWEVKVHALQFWELEIAKQFTDQGMIDNVFPTVTFSKENKKIVTLTEKEVNLRIAKVFTKLSQRGCLGVILKCLSDNCDLEVMKTAAAIVKRMLQKLKSYDYVSIVHSVEVPKGGAATPEAMATEQASPQMDVTEDEVEGDLMPNADEVIESILGAQDINLLVTTYENQMKLNASGVKPTIPKNLYRDFAHVTGKDFVDAVQKLDLNQIVQCRVDWMECSESFVSLLDDIMFSIQPTDETNQADCY